ncbi:single-stranded DNA-binding protein [Streptomyces krungchingensis]
MFDPDRNEFIDGDPLFFRCSLWRQAGENAAQSLTRGLRIIITGKLRQRTLDDKDGQRRTMMEIDAEDVAVFLTYARAQFTKTCRQGMPSQGGPAPTPDLTQPSSPAPAESHPF